MSVDLQIAALPVRKASGVQASISRWTAFLFGIHCISLSSSGIIVFAGVGSVWPGASIVGVLTIALIFCIIHASAVSVIGRIAPQEGADYVFASRVVSPRLAFAFSWTFVLFSGVVAGGLAAWVPTTALPGLLRPIAIIFHDPQYADLADFASSKPGIVMIGGLIIAIAAFTTVQAGAFLRSLLTAGFIFGVLAWAVILWSLAHAHGPDAFRDAWNHFMSSSSAYGAFDKRIPLAEAAGMHISHSVSQMTLGGLIMGFWIYYGYYIPTFFAEEVKRPQTTLIVASLSSLLFAYVIFVSAALLMNRLVPSDWIAAEGYIANNHDLVKVAAGGRDIVAMPWITFYAAILQPAPVLVFIVTFGWLFTLINLVQTYLFYSSRIVFSWAQDRVVPDWLLGPPGNPSFNRAVLMISLLAAIGLIDAANGGPLGTQLTFAFFAVVTQLVPLFALTVLPKLRPELFKRLPEWLRRAVLGVPLSSYLAALTLAYLLWMTIASFVFPAAGIANPLATVSILVLFVLSGLCVFVTMRRHRKKFDDIDIEDTYRSIEGTGGTDDWV